MQTEPYKTYPIKIDLHLPTKQHNYEASSGRRKVNLIIIDP